jgi:hypothetical protein
MTRCKFLLQTFAIMGKSINQYELKDADVVVRPSLVRPKALIFQPGSAMDAGRAAMLAALPALKAKLALVPQQDVKMLCFNSEKRSRPKWQMNAIRRNKRGQIADKSPIPIGLSLRFVKLDFERTRGDN